MTTENKKDAVEALDVRNGSALKAEIAKVLQSALNGSDASLRYETYWIRWGLVEQRINALVDAAFAAPNASGQPRDTTP